MPDIAPHQAAAIEKMHNGCILLGGTGVGKTRTAIAYFFSKVCGGTIGDILSVTNPMHLVVITTAKKRNSLDWEKEAAAFGIGKLEGGTIPGIMITVDSWNNIEDYVDYKNVFFIFDEQRAVGGGLWAKSLIKIAKHNEWIMLSATPGDTWMDYIPVFLANGFYKNRTEFIRRHVVYASYVTKYPKIERYLEVGHLVRLRNSILVQMPYKRKTVRKSVTVPVQYDVALFERVVKDRWHVYEDRPLRDAAELFSVMRKVVNSDSSRIEAIRRLMEKHPRVIVFYNFDYELEMLRDLSGKTQSNASTSQETTVQESSDPLKGTIWEAGWDPSKESGGMSSKSSGSTPSTESSSMSVIGSSTLPSSSEERSISATDLAMIETEEDRSESCLIELLSHEKNSKRSSEESVTISGTGSSITIEPPISISTKSRTTSSITSDLSGQSSEHPRLSKISTSSRVESKDATDSSTTADFVVAELNGHKHDPVPTTERWVYLVQYVAGSEAWNCVDTDAMVFYSQTYSYKNHHQAHGRIDRMNTPFKELWYYHLMSDSMFDRAVSKSLHEKRSFNESSLGLSV